MQILILLLSCLLTMTTTTTRWVNAVPQISISLPSNIPGITTPAIPAITGSPTSADAPDVNGSNVIHSVSGSTTLVIGGAPGAQETGPTILSDTTQIITGGQATGQQGVTVVGGGGSLVTSTPYATSTATSVSASSSSTSASASSSSTSITSSGASSSSTILGSVREMSISATVSLTVAPGQVTPPSVATPASTNASTTGGNNAAEKNRMTIGSGVLVAVAGVVGVVVGMV